MKKLVVAFILIASIVLSCVAFTACDNSTVPNDSAVQSQQNSTGVNDSITDDSTEDSVRDSGSKDENPHTPASKPSQDSKPKDSKPNDDIQNSKPEDSTPENDPNPDSAPNPNPDPDQKPEENACKNILVVDGSDEFEQYGAISQGEVAKKLEGHKLTCVAPNQLSSSIDEIKDYDEILLLDVVVEELPVEVQKNIKYFVEVLGKGLFVSFGDNYYEEGNANFDESTIGQLLPVYTTHIKEFETKATVIIVDLSSSMKQIINSNNESRYDIVLNNVKNAITSSLLGDEDYLGVIVFSGDVHVVLEMQSVGDTENRERICEHLEYEFNHYYYAYYLNPDGTESDIKINERLHGAKGNNVYEKIGYVFPDNYRPGNIDLVTGDAIKSYGTSYKPAIQQASDMLDVLCERVRIELKNVIFLTDGAPADKGSGYDVIVEKMAKSGTVFSVVGIADGDYGEAQALAELGNGIYESVNSSEELAEAISRISNMLIPQLKTEGAFEIGIYRYNSSILIGINDFGMVNGYYTSSLKPEAKCVLYVEALRPIYIEWEYGQGKVCVFMSNLASEYTSSLYENEDTITLIAKMLLAATQG